MMAWAKMKVAAGIVAAVATAGVGGGAAVLALANGDGPAKQDVAAVKGFTYRGQVVDKGGRPVTDAEIELRAFMQGQASKWSGRTDGSGRFQWTNLHSAKVLLTIAKPGFRGIVSREVEGTGQEQTIKLMRVMTVKGRVVDAHSGKIVAGCQAMPGAAWSTQQQIGVERDRVQTCPDGAFTIDFQWQYPINIVHVEALGYKSADSRVLTDDEGEVTCDFRLEPAQNITGLVLLPDGKPAAGADIYLPGAPGAVLSLEDPAARLGQRGPTSRPVARVTTGVDGRFSLPPQEGFAGLVVVHADGFAQVSADELTKSDRVGLERWSSITGHISAPLRSGAGQKASYFSDRSDVFSRFQLLYRIEAPVDEQGTFVLDHVPPGRGVVSRDMPMTRAMTEMHFRDHGVPVTVDPGKMAEVQIGGGGVGVTGRVQTPAGSDWRLADTYAYVQLQPVPGKIESPKWPADLDRKDPAKVKVWYEQWVKTPEAKVWLATYQAYQDTFKISYSNGIGGDGVFQVQEVPPGRYELTISVSGLNHGPSWGGGKGLARLHREVVVQPNAGDGRQADLGALQLELPPAPVTQPAGSGR